MHLFRVALIGLLLVSSSAFSETIDQGFHYPELEVAPHASQRIADEVKYEERQDLLFMAPWLLPGALNLMAGIGYFQETKNDEKLSKTPAGVAIGIGGFWVATAFVLPRNYRPYTDAQRSLQKMNGKSERDQLVRERYAEERLMSAARFGRYLKYIGILSNFAAGAGISSQSKSANVQAFAAGAMVFSILPWFFEPRWEENYDRHEEYKRKIYAPLAQISYLQDPHSHWRPALSLTWAW